jgi:excinuclease ABC subunit C
MTTTDYHNCVLPDKPGVYRFVDGSGVILYIGRATSLRDRTRSYFSKDLLNDRGMAFIDMVSRAVQLLWVETDSVMEAILLEVNLIKKFQPYYNTKEKDNKSYYYVVITDEDFSRVLLERERVLTDSPEKLQYKVLEKYGPFPSGPTIRETLRLLRKIFPFQSGKTRNPARDRFYASIGLHSGYKEKNQNIAISVSEYSTMIQDLMLVLSGDQKQLKENLNNRMQQHSALLEFESAAHLRNVLWSLSHIQDVSLIKMDTSNRDIRSIRIEAYDVAHLAGTSMVGVMVVLENGEPQPSEYRKFIIRNITTANDPAALLQILTRRMRHSEWRMPNILVTDGNNVQMSVAENVVTVFHKDISVVSVVKDERHKARDILGDQRIISVWRDAILLANAEAHRYSLEFHKNRRAKAFIPTKTPKKKTID